jgi:hypothetical protein
MPTVGSIFRVDLEPGRCKYFWCVGKDTSQLHSDLIVVFRRSYDPALPLDVEAIVADDVEFYCHVLIPIGKKLGSWKKVGFRHLDRIFPMQFRGSADYGDPSIRVSERWYVWTPNRQYRDVGRLTGDLTRAELGMVMPPDSIVERMRTGRYGIQHPTYDSALEPCA